MLEATSIMMDWNKQTKKAFSFTLPAFLLSVARHHLKNLYLPAMLQPLQNKYLKHEPGEWLFDFCLGDMMKCVFTKRDHNGQIKEVILPKLRSVNHWGSFGVFMGALVRGYTVDCDRQAAPAPLGLSDSSGEWHHSCYLNNIQKFQLLNSPTQACYIFSKF